jgi:hypothetical protein
VLNASSSWPGLSASLSWLFLLRAAVWLCPGGWPYTEVKTQEACKQTRNGPSRHHGIDSRMFHVVSQTIQTDNEAQMRACRLEGSLLLRLLAGNSPVLCCSMLATKPVHWHLNKVVTSLATHLNDLAGGRRLPPIHVEAGDVDFVLGASYRNASVQGVKPSCH